MFVVPTLDEIRASILRDMQALDPQADVSVDSDNYARASSLAAVAEGIYAHQKWLIKQFFPDTADTEFLENTQACVVSADVMPPMPVGVVPQLQGNPTRKLKRGCKLKPMITAFLRP